MTDTTNLRQDIQFEVSLGGQPMRFATTWGLFSPKAIDEGTDLLISQMASRQIAPDARCLDLGCGYGPLGLWLAKRVPQGEIHLVDKDFVAVEYAKRNAALNGLGKVQAYLSNGFDQVPPGITFDLIVSNIPAKIGGELLSIFLADAHARLKPGGEIYIVTISGLKDYMKRHLGDTFGNYSKLKQSRTYTAAMSTRQ